MNIVNVTYGNTCMITSNYTSAYNDIINDLAYLQLRPKNNYSEKYKNDLLDGAIKYLIKAETENMKKYVDSDYDFFIDNDEGALFDLINNYYENKSENIIKALGQRIIRNYEINAMKKIDIDVKNALNDIVDMRRDD